MDSPLVVTALTPSNTLACRAAGNVLLISGLFSRTVRAARAELLVSGIKPTFFSATGMMKCKCFQRWETPRIATSSTFTFKCFANFSARAGKDSSSVVSDPAPSVLDRRSNSDKKVLDMNYDSLQMQTGVGAGTLRETPPSLLPVCLQPVSFARNIQNVCVF